jgi:cytochrome P450
VATIARPSGPPGALPVLGHFPAYARDPLGFMTRVTTDYGGVAPIRLGPSPALLIADPSAIEEVLVVRNRDFRKSRVEHRIGTVVGKGLVLAEGDVWRQHRRLVQPAFHRDRITGWGDIMVGEADSAVRSWRDGDVLDLHAEMTALTLAIVARTILGSELQPDDVATVRAAVAPLEDHFDSRFNSLAFFVPDWLPTPGNRRMRAAVQRLDRIVYRLIRSRRASEGRGDDAISMLVEASRAPADRLSDRELRDEVMTLFMAGHETTSLALTWSLYLVGIHAGADRALDGELAAVLDGRLPNVGDIPQLRYTEAVVLEALRLYPPAYALSREAIVATSVAGHSLPSRGIAFISIWATHRRPDLFDDPVSFRPERWLEGLARHLPRGAYLPFAEGPRKCIGASFAMQEAILALATIAQRVRLRPVDDQPVRLRPAVTLRPAEPIRMTVAARGASASGSISVV